MAEINELPVSSLMDRYGVNRSQIYVRLDALKRLDASLEPTKRGKKAFINARMLEILDGMAALIAQGYTTEHAAEQVVGFVPQPDRMPDSLARQDRTDISTRDLVALMLAMQQNAQLEDDLAVFRKLQELADNDWRPSTSQLTQMMDVNSLPSGDSFERYGFRFSKAGKNGTETAWKVEKL